MMFLFPPNLLYSDLHTFSLYSYVIYFRGPNVLVRRYSPSSALIFNQCIELCSASRPSTTRCLQCQFSRTMCPAPKLNETGPKDFSGLSQDIHALVGQTLRHYTSQTPDSTELISKFRFLQFGNHFAEVRSALANVSRPIITDVCCPSHGSGRRHRLSLEFDFLCAGTPARSQLTTTCWASARGCGHGIIHRPSFANLVLVILLRYCFTKRTPFCPFHRARQDVVVMCIYPYTTLHGQQQGPGTDELVLAVSLAFTK